MANDSRITGEIMVGVVGLGLMGSSIVASLLLSGHEVIAIAPLPTDIDGARDRIISQLQHSECTGLLTEPVDAYMERLVISENFTALRPCQLVLECIIEVLEIKNEVYQKIAKAVSVQTIIASNTSAIPISCLQQFVPQPERFLGIHWSEPAYMTRFLEVTCGEKTALSCAEWVCQLAGHWSKEPTLLRKDIRGFITNRLMYAVYREGLALMEKGEATLEDIDKAFRYDAGSWMTLVGIFRRLDYLGLQDGAAILKNLLPVLSKNEEVPPVMQKIVADKSRGIHNLKGLFTYTPDEAKKWEEAFAVFNQEIFHLAKKYPTEIDPA